MKQEQYKITLVKIMYLTISPERYGKGTVTKVLVKSLKQTHLIYKLLMLFAIFGKIALN